MLLVDMLDWLCIGFGREVFCDRLCIRGERGRKGAMATSVLKKWYCGNFQKSKNSF